MRILKTLCMMCIIFIIGSLRVEASEVSLPDGTVINRNTVWESVPSSYQGVSFYDVLVPYAKKVSDIGGHAVGGKDGTTYADTNVMSDGLLSNGVGDYTTREMFIGRSKVTVGGSYTMNCRSDNGLNIVSDENGNEYILLALGHYFYHGPQGTLPFSSDNRGQLVDIVLTDGTIIHGIIHDAKADVHTNGGEGTEHKGDEDRTRDYYKFAELTYPEAQNMFQALNSEVIEIFANVSGLNKFNQTYGLGGGDCTNHIAFIRMYAQTVDTAGHLRDTAVGKEVSYSVGSVTFAKGETTSYEYGSASLSITGSSLVDEWEISGMPIRHDMTTNQVAVVLMGRDSLSLSEAEAIAMMGENIALLKEAELLDGMRTAIVFIGLVVILYGFMLMLAMVFDKANTFIDMSLVSVMTLGKVKYDPFESAKGVEPKGYVSTRKLSMMAIIILLVGVLLVSSGMTKLIGNVLYLVTSKMA